MVESIEFIESLAQAVKSELGITGHPYTTVILTVLLGAEEDVSVAERIIENSYDLDVLPCGGATIRLSGWKPAPSGDEKDKTSEELKELAAQIDAGLAGRLGVIIDKDNWGDIERKIASEVQRKQAEKESAKKQIIDRRVSNIMGSLDVIKRGVHVGEVLLDEDED